MAWTAPRPIELSVQDTSFARGGFREVFKAKIATAGFGDNKWVAKKNLPDTLKCIEDLGQTIEQHTKKAVQMHALAKNIAERFQKKASDIQAFGSRFEYTSSYLGKLESGELFTMERFSMLISRNT
eukprot:gene12465-biopygen9935